MTDKPDRSAGAFYGKLKPPPEENTNPPGGKPESAHDRKIRKGLAGLRAIQVANRRKLKKPESQPKHRLGTPRQD